MDYRHLGSAGLKVSALALGTATFGGVGQFFGAWGRTDLGQARRLLAIAQEAGVNLIDCADSYSRGTAEEILGHAIAGTRSQWLIATKATCRMGEGVNDLGSSRHHLIASCESSLRRLQTDCIDLWQMHTFDAATPLEETLRAIDDLVRAGKVRYAGCSNFSGWHLMKSLGISERNGYVRYVAHQVYYCLIAREFEWELMPLAQSERIGTLVWSPLAGGQLSGKLRRDQAPPERSRFAQLGSMGPACPRDRLFAVLDVLDAIAQETGRSIAEIALNWVLHRPTVASVIIGARDEEQLRVNLGAADFRLDETHLRSLDQVSEIPPTYPYWHQWTGFAERNPPPVRIDLPQEQRIRGHPG